MREKIKNILSSSYTKQGEFNEGKALNELCVLLGVSNCLHDKTLYNRRNPDGRYWCNKCKQLVK